MIKDDCWCQSGSLYACPHIYSHVNTYIHRNALPHTCITDHVYNTQTHTETHTSSCTQHSKNRGNYDYSYEHYLFTYTLNHNCKMYVVKVFVCEDICNFQGTIRMNYICYCSFL